MDSTEEKSIIEDVSTSHEFSWKSFTNKSVLAKGSFGTIYKAQCKDQWYVVKVIDLNTMSEEKSIKALEEINIQGRCHSDYIVQYYDSFLDEEK